MFAFFEKKKSLLELGVLEGLADHHSHILPGVDDGMRTTAESLEALDACGQAGVARVWLTPHIMEDFPNSTVDLRSRFDKLKADYAAAAGGHPVELCLAAEHMIDTLFVERLAARDVLSVGDSRLLLVETSYFNPPADLFGILASVASAGYTPLLAHPERYMYMTPADYDRLHAMGVLMQLNIVSVAGAYGREAAARAEALLRKGYYYMAGSDMHSLRATTECLQRPIKASVAKMAAEFVASQNGR